MQFFSYGLNKNRRTRIQTSIKEIKVMAAISVIIPCYNVASYIDRCLTSITSPTLDLSPKYYLWKHHRHR